MKFQEAKERLIEMAGGKFCALEFKLVVFGHNSPKEEIKCHVYIEGHEYETGMTWGEALERMKIKVNNIEPKQEELPEVEV